MLPDLINQLGAGSVPVIADSQFDNLFVVKSGVSVRQV
jgi:hypothetical protein